MIQLVGSKFDNLFSISKIQNIKKTNGFGCKKTDYNTLSRIFHNNSMNDILKLCYEWGSEKYKQSKLGGYLVKDNEERVLSFITLDEYHIIKDIYVDKQIEYSLTLNSSFEYESLSKITRTFYYVFDLISDFIYFENEPRDDLMQVSVIVNSNERNVLSALKNIGFGCDKNSGYFENLNYDYNVIFIDGNINMNNSMKNNFHKIKCVIDGDFLD